LHIGDVVDVRVQCLDAASTTLDISWGNFNIVSIGGTTGASAPTLDAITSPYLASEVGGGVSVTLSGTNLATVSNLTVGGSPASSVSSTATTVTFTWPALAANTTPYDIQVTTPSGNYTLHNAVFYLPSCVLYCWYAAYGFNGGTGAWTDQFAGVTASLTMGSAPSLTPLWANGQPAVTSTTTLLSATATVFAQPWAVFVVGDITGTGEQLQCTLGTNDAVGTHTDAYYSGFIVGSWNDSAQSTLSSPFLAETYVNGNSSYWKFNGGSAQTFMAASTSTSSSTVTLLGYPSIGFYAVGDTSLILIASSPTSGQEAIIHAVSQQIWGTP
jgi:IPT/TIG domain-containing protein